MNPEGSLQAVWMLPCATCLSSFSRVVFEHFCDSVEAYSFYVESIGLLKSKSITPLIFFFFVLSCRSSGCLISTCPDGEESSGFHVFFILGFALSDSF